LGALQIRTRSAARVLALETGIARSHAPDADAADVLQAETIRGKRADFGVKAPGMDWNTYFRAADCRQSDFIVWQPTAAIGTSALVDSGGIEAWKDYLRFHLNRTLFERFAKSRRCEDFAFYGTILSGCAKAPERQKAAIDATNAALGQAVGQLYTHVIFHRRPKQK